MYSRQQENRNGRLRATAAIVLLATAAVACGGDDDDAATDTTSAPVATEAPTETDPAEAAAAEATPTAEEASETTEAATPTTAASECAGPLDEPVKVTFGVLPNVNAAPMYVAVAKGYFGEDNLEVEYVNAGTSAEAQPLVATGRLDGLYAGPSAGFFNGLASGQAVKFATGSGQYRPGGAASAYVTLPGSPIQSVADLAGQKVAVPGGIPAVSGFYLAELLEQAGLTVNDVEIVPLSVVDGLAALTNGAVVAAMSSGPQMTAGLADGSQVLVGDMDKVLAEGNSGGFILGPTLLEENRCAGVAFVRGLLRANREDLQGEYLQNQEIVDIVATATGFPPDVIASTVPPLFDEDLATTDGVYQNMQTFWRSQNVLDYETDLAIEQIVDQALMEEAQATYQS